MMFRYYPGLHHGPGVFAWFFLALLAALVVLGVIALVRMWSHPQGRFTHVQPGPPPTPPVDPALTELRVRYARGEISWEDYVKRAGDLGYPVYGGAGREPGAPPGSGQGTPAAH